MSIDVMSMIWKRAPYEGGALLVLLALADWGDDDGTNIFPTVKKVAIKSRLTVRAVQQNLKKLKDDKIIVLVNKASGKPGRANEWRIDVERLQQLRPISEKMAQADGEESQEVGGEEIAGVDAVPATNCTPRNSELDERKDCTPQGVDTSEAGSRVHGSSPRDATKLTPTGANCSISPTPPYIDIHHTQPPSHPPSRARAKDQSLADEEMPSFLRRYGDAEFERFMGAFPLTGESKAEAFAAWGSTKSERPPIADLLAALADYVAQLKTENARRPSTNQRQACFASKWLRERRWEAYAAKIADAAQAESAATERAGLYLKTWRSLLPLADKLRKDLGAGVFDQWLAPCRLGIDFDRGQATLFAPRKLIRDYVRLHHLPRLEHELEPLSVGVELDEKSSASVAA